MAILVYQGSNPTVPYQALVIRERARLDCGYIVVSDTRDRLDGWIMLRKGKERGYEAGKEPNGVTDKNEAARHFAEAAATMRALSDIPSVAGKRNNFAPGR
jgi:hypothetical protein